MATSKIKPIKATLRKAIDYIINPEKKFENTLEHIPGTTNTLTILGVIANSLIQRYNMKKRW